MSLITTQTINWDTALGATQYIVKYKKSIDSIWITTIDSPIAAPTTFCTISDLDYCTSYDFSIEADCSSFTSTPQIITGTTLNNHNTNIVERFTIETPILNDESLNPDPNIIAIHKTSSSFGVSTKVIPNDGNYTDGYGHSLLCYYQDGTVIPLYSSYIVTLTASFWNNTSGSNGRANDIAVQPGYNCSTPIFPVMPTIGSPLKISYGFNYTYYCRDLTLLYIGFQISNYSGTEGFQILIDGLLYLNIISAPVKFQLYPIHLDSGSHIITMVNNYSTGASTVTPPLIAIEIYKNTLAELQAAISPSDLKIVFSTSWEFCKPFHIGTTLGWSCPLGYYLDTTDYLTTYDTTKLRCIKRAP